MVLVLKNTFAFQQNREQMDDIKKHLLDEAKIHEELIKQHEVCFHFVSSFTASEINYAGSNLFSYSRKQLSGT